MISGKIKCSKVIRIINQPDLIFTKPKKKFCKQNYGGQYSKIHWFLDILCNTQKIYLISISLFLFFLI